MDPYLTSQFAISVYCLIGLLRDASFIFIPSALPLALSFFKLCRCSAKGKEIHEILNFLRHQKFIRTLIHIYRKGIELGLG